MNREAIEALLAKVESARSDDWRVEDEVIKALGGSERVVSGISLKGSYRTPGRKMVQWPDKDKPSPWPYFLRNEAHKAKAIRKLRALLATGGSD